MISVTKIFRFEAAHRLPNHQGKCCRYHGHTYTLEVEFAGERIKKGPSAGMIVDFGDIKAMMKPILEQLDHRDLNDVLDNPTAENLIVWIVDEIQKVNSTGARLNRLRLYETPDSFAEWRRWE